MFEHGLIVAGGEGKRLRPLTDSIPKPLLPIGEKPIIESIIEKMRKAGIGNIFISVNYKKELIKNYLRDGTRLDVRIKYLEEHRFTGTAGCLTLLPRDFNQPLLMSNGDLVSDIDYASLYALVQDYDLVVTGVEKVFPVDFGVLHCNGDNELHSWEEKPQVKYLINAGVYAISPALVGFIRAKIDLERQIDMPELWRVMKESNMRIGIHRHTGKWVDVGRLDDYLSMTQQA